MALVAVAALALSLLSPASPATAAQETLGVDFWVGFNANLGSPELTIFISGGTATTGTVTPTGSAGIPFSVTPGAVTSVPIPASYQMTATDGVEDKGIHVQANAPVSVYGLNRIQFTTDAYLAIPTEAAGTEFRTLAYATSGRGGGFGAVATANGTVLTITPQVALTGHPAGVPFQVNLNQGQTYQLQDAADMSGTLVTSNLPISLYGYALCTNIPQGVAFCDHIVEQLPPRSAWGTSFLAARLANRVQGDTFRVLADEAGTVVNVDGVDVATLGAGEFYEALIPPGAVAPSNTGIQITTTKPALLAQYSNGSTFDGVQSDPFMMLIPPFEQFQSNYTVTTPASGFTSNFLNVVVRTADLASFRLDGAAVDPAQFAPIGATAFSSAQLAVSLGSHTVSNATPFGVFVYGFAQDDSYGYPGGYLLSPIASAATLTLDQAAYSATVNGQVCPVATVLDNNGAPLEGLTVTFNVDNPAVALTAVTNAQGQATVCFTNGVASTGTLTATTGLTIGTLTATASVTFADAVPDTTTTTTPLTLAPATPATPISARPRFAG